jgi:hypothetical protein
MMRKYKISLICEGFEISLSRVSISISMNFKDINPDKESGFLHSSHSLSLYAYTISSRKNGRRKLHCLP